MISSLCTSLRLQLSSVKEVRSEDPKCKTARVSRPQPHAHGRDRSDVQRAAQRPGAPVRAEAGPQQLRVRAADAAAPLRGPAEGRRRRGRRVRPKCRGERRPRRRE